MSGIIRQLLQQIVNLLQLGSIYGLLAIGFSIVYGIAGLVNFAHGMIFMCATYFLYFFGILLYNITDQQALVLLVGFVGASVLTALLAVIIEKIAYKPLRNAPKVSVIVSSVGVSMILEYMMLNIVGPNPYRMHSFVTDRKYTVWGVNFSLTIILIVVISIGAMLILNLYIKRSKIGIALRAVSQDNLAAGLMGISTNYIISVAFVLGAIMATFGAILYHAAYPTFNPYIGAQINWWSFTAAVIGGIGSIKGAIMGGYLLAAVNVFSPMFLPVSSWRDVVAFGVLIIVLLIKPTGLLGKASIQKV